MNIFYLDEDPIVCAKMHCDKHVVKMILEYAQLMSTAHRLLNPEEADAALYKSTHSNHPSAIWARQTSGNYHWLFNMWDQLLSEYTARYGRYHKSQSLWTKLIFAPKSIPSSEMTPIPQCMPDHCKIDGNAVAAYRNYYVTEKSAFARWKNGAAPSWMKNHEQY